MNDALLATVEMPLARPEGPFRVQVRSPGQVYLRRLPRGGTLTIGSCDRADLTIEDRTVSGLHCRLVAGPEGVVLEDLGSKNGIRVGGGAVRRAILVGGWAEFSIGESHVCVEGVKAKEAALGLVGESRAIRELRELIARYAELSAPVMILGESGTGKDLVARALHAESRRLGQYVALNVAAFPDTLIDAELFGHVRGAFTGAVADRAGAFELADRGSLFLDEIADLSPMAQAKLLRVVEEHQVRPVGSTKLVPARARILSATCGDLHQRRRDGRFRPDLYHRLSTLLIEVPPLRARPRDIPLLVDAFLKSRVAELGPKTLDAACAKALMDYRWPGNVRELFGATYRAAVHARTSLLCRADYSFSEPAGRGTLAPPVEQAFAVLDSTGSVSAAARALGMPRSTFRALLRRAQKAGRPDSPSVSPVFSEARSG